MLTTADSLNYLTGGRLNKKMMGEKEDEETKVRGHIWYEEPKRNRRALERSGEGSPIKNVNARQICEKKGNNTTTEFFLCKA